MRLAFLGTPDAGVATLRALVEARHEIVIVVTRADRRRSRGGALVPSPVKLEALARGLRVTHQLTDLDTVDVDWGVVVAYGVVLPAPVLAKIPMLNVHFSLLPRWRGAAPVQRAILAGDEVTGVSIISLEPTLDTGPIHLARTVRMGQKTAHELTVELAEVGARALVDVLATPELLAHPRAQEGEATYAKKILTDSLRLSPATASELVLRTVRLGGAWIEVASKRVLVVGTHSAGELVPSGTITLRDGRVLLGVRDGAVVLDVVRPAGSNSMSATAWWNGLREVEDPLVWS